MTLITQSKEDRTEAGQGKHESHTLSVGTFDHFSCFYNKVFEKSPLHVCQTCLSLFSFDGQKDR